MPTWAFFSGSSKHLDSHHYNRPHLALTSLRIRIQDKKQPTNRGVAGLCLGTPIPYPLKEVIKRTWLPVDPWAGPRQSEVPHPLPAPWNACSALCSHSGSCSKDAALSKVLLRPSGQYTWLNPVKAINPLYPQVPHPWVQPTSDGKESKINSNGFWKAKIEFTSGPVTTWHLHCIYTYLHSIYIVLGIVCNLKMI